MRGGDQAIRSAYNIELSARNRPATDAQREGEAMQEQTQKNAEFWKRKIGEDFNYNAADFNTWMIKRWEKE